MKKIGGIIDPRDWKQIVKRLTIKYSSPEYHDVLEDLEAFTGFKIPEIIFRIMKKRGRLNRHASGWFDTEYEYHSPVNDRELRWFYCSAQSYLFSNARRGEWEVLKHVKEGPVLDYGAGIGQNVIALAKKGFDVSYMEIGIIQREFVKFRARRHNVKVHFCDPYAGSVFNPLNVVHWEGKKYKTILLQHVLEHIPNYQHTLTKLIQHLDDGGLIIEHSPFVKTAISKMHLLEKMKLASVMEQNGMKLKIASHKKYKEPQVWEKSI